MTTNAKAAVLPAVDAATVMVVGEANAGQASAGFEVFMVRRNQKSGFMANAYVYPGGKLDEADCAAHAASFVVGLSPEAARQRLGDVACPHRALGLFLAGVRETFEEAGILLARRRGESEAIDLTSDPEVAARFAKYRKDLQEGRLSLSALALMEELVLDLGRVGYFAHWITPYFEKRRFDTRFFVAAAPPHQRPLHDAVETTDSLWVRPGQAIDRYRSGGLFLAPPTLRTLEQLAEFETVDSLLAFAADHQPPAILPHLAEGDEIALLLPGDRDFPVDDPLYTSATPVCDGCTRMVMRDGCWQSIFEG